MREPLREFETSALFRRRRGHILDRNDAQKAAWHRVAEIRRFSANVNAAVLRFVAITRSHGPRGLRWRGVF